MQARLFYGDVNTKQMYEFVIDDAGEPLPIKILSVNHDAQGELYVLGLALDPMGTPVGHVLRVVPAVDGDFNGDNEFDCADVDSLVSVIVSQSNESAYDMTNDGLVNHDDLEAWLVAGGAANPEATGGGPFLPGDANVDGIVDGEDFQRWNAERFTAAPAWCSADFNADGFVDGFDLLIWNQFKFTSSDHEESSIVPEPSFLWLGLIFAVYIGPQRRLKQA